MIHAPVSVGKIDGARDDDRERRRAARIGAALLIGQFVAMWMAFFTLAPAINWSTSLGEPPAVILPLIH